jgi:hypothetical protein
MWGRLQEACGAGLQEACGAGLQPCNGPQTFARQVQAGRTPVVLIGRRMTPPANVRCPPGAPLLRAARHPSALRPCNRHCVSDLEARCCARAQWASDCYLPGCELRHQRSFSLRRRVGMVRAGGSQLPVSSDAAAARREHPTRESAHCTAASVPPPPGTPEILRSRTGTAFDSRHTTPRDRAIRGHVRRMRALRRHAAPG